MTPPHPALAPRSHGSPATRRAVLDAAEALFTQRGYAATTITEIARHARVGTNTVYVGFGNKPGIVVGLVERVADAASGHDFDEQVPRVDVATGVIDELARTTRATHERFHHVVALAFDTATTDPAIRQALQVALDGYRQRLRDAAVRIQELGELASTLTVSDAVDLLWFYLGPPPWRTTIEMGWSWDHAEAFLADAAKHAVVDQRTG